MSSRRAHEFKENLERCYNMVQQSSAKGISAIEVAKKLGKHRTTVHSYLNTLEYMGRVESQHGIWHAKKEEPTARPLEKEIVIELPLPKGEWQRMALLEWMGNDWEEAGLPEDGNVYRISLEKLRETRTIRVKGKNVDSLDLEKLGDLIRQANEKSSKGNLKGLLKSLRRPRASKEKTETRITPAESSSA